MSIKLVARVWEMDIPRPEQLLLLALADHARDDGTKVYPSIGHIAWKTGYKRRQVQRIIASLRRRGVLAVVKAGGGEEATEYRLHLDVLPEKTPYRSYPRQNDAGGPQDTPPRHPGHPASPVTREGRHSYDAGGGVKMTPQSFSSNRHVTVSPPTPPYDRRKDKRASVRGPLAPDIQALADRMGMP